MQDPKTVLGEQYIRQKAKIYGKDSTKKLRLYEQRINESAIQLALEDPTLINCRQQLLEAARKKVNETYAFRKGASRAKGSDTDSTPKRLKTSEETRIERIGELEEDVKDFNDRLTYKERVRESANMARNYKLCDQVTEEMSAIRKQKRECEQELAIWKKKQQQSKWYRKKVQATRNTSTGTPESCMSETDPDSEYSSRSRSTSVCTSEDIIAPNASDNSPLDSPVIEQSQQPF